MKTRIITAIVAVALFIPVLYFSDTVVFELVMGLFGLVATLEVTRCIGVQKHPSLVIPALLYSIALPAITLLCDGQAGYPVLLFATLIYLFILLFVGVFRALDLHVDGYGVLFALSVYAALPFTALIYLRRADHGLYLCLLVFIISWMTDTFAYFTGYFFGKHKLAPIVSPKKTIEGSVGGTLLAVAACIGYGYLISVLDDAVTPNYLALALTGLILSIVSQLGDLAASAVKRNYGIKDYGNLFPGHGGILDRFDSVIAVSTFMWILQQVPDLFRVFTYA